MRPQIGDIYRCSWGYDQTNVDYYQVTRVTDKSVWIREVCQSRDYDGFMRGHASPALNEFQKDSVETVHRWKADSKYITVRKHYRAKLVGKSDVSYFSEYA